MNTNTNSESLQNGCPTKRRILETACRFFSESGFRGAHLREICEDAGVNIAAVCYHFHRKERLYEAVAREAGLRLCEPQEKGCPWQQTGPPEERLRRIVEFLFEKLGGSQVWIAKLLARELVEPLKGISSSVSSRLEDVLVALESIFRELLGPDADRDELRLRALSLVSLCVYYCLAEDKRHSLDLPAPIPRDRLRLERHVTCFCLGKNFHPSGNVAAG